MDLLLVFIYNYIRSIFLKKIRVEKFYWLLLLMFDCKKFWYWCNMCLLLVDGKVNVVVFGIGIGGTLVGVGIYFKDKNKNV